LGVEGLGVVGVWVFGNRGLTHDGFGWLPSFVFGLLFPSSCHLGFGASGGDCPASINISVEVDSARKSRWDQLQARATSSGGDKALVIDPSEGYSGDSDKVGLTK
jgi:hypothetical protein